MANERLVQQSDIKLLISKGLEQGYLTYAEVNDHLPDDMVDPEQIEDIIGMINGMGIEVHEVAPDAETLLLAGQSASGREVDDTAAEEAAAALTSLDGEGGRTCGMRVEPPTMTTPCTSSRARCASRRARRTAAMERAVKSAVTASKSERLTSNCTEALDKSALNATKSVAVSASLHWRAAMRTADLSAGVTACCPTCCSTHSASAAS